MAATEKHTDLTTQPARYADPRIVLGPDRIDLTVTPFRVRVSARGVACLVVASATPAALVLAAARSARVSGYFSLSLTGLVYLATLGFLLLRGRHTGRPAGSQAPMPAAFRAVHVRQDPGGQPRNDPARR